MKKTIITIIAIVISVFSCMTFVACQSDDSGKSAYEIAVENGFEGTEEEWLESLKGDDGKDGVNGIDGTNGKNGIDGKDNNLTVDDYYKEAVANGYDGTKLEFIQEFLNVEYVPDDKYTVAKNLLSSVSIVCGFQVTTYNIIGNPFVGYSYDYDNPIVNTNYGMGSGVFYDIDKTTGSGYVITNYHVVYNAGADKKISEDISVYLYGGEMSGQEIKATYVGGSMTYDIAVLKIENNEILKKSSVTAVTFADSNDIVVGQKAIAIGNAEGAGISATSGVISVDSENIEMLGADEKTTIRFRVMRVDCAVNSGNSGGGLFDSEGKLIGIVNAKIMTEEVENIGYALPANIVRYVADNIIEGGGVVKKCQLGVTVVTNQSKAVFNEEKGIVEIIENVVVYENESENVKIAENALVYGKLKSGDVLKSVKVDKDGDGEIEKIYEITRSFILVDVMLTMRVGDKLTITIERTEKGENNQDVTETIDYTFQMTDECITEVA